MTQRDIELARVQKAIAKNNSKLKTANQNAVLSEVHIKTYESQIEYQTTLYNDRINKLKLQIDRSVENAKKLHDNLDELLDEKEALHLELKAASHFGKEKCEYCNKYFTPQGIVRHKAACASKPEIKIEKKHKEEITEHKDDLEARKAALQKQLEDLEKVAKE